MAEITLNSWGILIYHLRHGWDNTENLHWKKIVSRKAEFNPYNLFSFAMVLLNVEDFFLPWAVS